MNRIDRFCEAIMAFEGWRPGSISYRHCNPGNLRWSAIAVMIKDGYCVFNTFADGWNALVRDVTIKASGQSRTSIRPESSIQTFFAVYAPSADGNHPKNYAQFVIARAKLPPECTVGDLLLREEEA